MRDTRPVQGRRTSTASTGVSLRDVAPTTHTRTAHEYVRSVLRQAILNGTLSGGARLVQAELAAELEVSTTPVREALRDLATEGLIHLDAHRGAVVRNTDMAEVREVYELRKLLEPHAIRCAMETMTETELEQAGAFCEQMDSADDPAEWTRLNRQFHTTFIQAARRPRLASILDQLTDAATSFVALGVRSSPQLIEEGAKDHRELIAAFEKGDVAKAEKIVVHHLQSTLEVLEQLEEQSRAVESG